MPPKKGRKRHPDRERNAPVATPAPRPVAMQDRGALRPPMRPQSSLPSRNARMSGFLVAIVTAFLAVALIRDATVNASGTEATLRIIAGGSLVLLAIVVGALVLFPERLRSYFASRRGE
jgi:hypothetical protein